MTEPQHCEFVPSLPIFKGSLANKSMIGATKRWSAQVVKVCGRCRLRRTR